MKTPHLASWLLVRAGCRCTDLCDPSHRGKLTHTEAERQECRREHFCMYREVFNLSREICSVSFSHAHILSAFQMLFLSVKQPTEEPIDIEEYSLHQVVCHFISFLIIFMFIVCY